MTNDRFVYVTYIRTTPEKLWQAFLDPEFNRLYWFGIRQDGTKAAGWKLRFSHGVADAGGVIEIEKPRRLVLKWRNEFRPELRAEGYSRAFRGRGGKLTVTHEIDKPQSKLTEAVSGGWPKILANLKSLIETGAVVSQSLRKSA